MASGMDCAAEGPVERELTPRYPRRARTPRYLRLLPEVPNIAGSVPVSAAPSPPPRALQCQRGMRMFLLRATVGEFASFKATTPSAEPQEPKPWACSTRAEHPGR
jgi:hypothetical protein